MSCPILLKVAKKSRGVIFMKSTAHDKIIYSHGREGAKEYKRQHGRELHAVVFRTAQTLKIRRKGDLVSTSRHACLSYFGSMVARDGALGCPLLHATRIRPLGRAHSILCKQ